MVDAEVETLLGSRSCQVGPLVVSHIVVHGRSDQPESLCDLLPMPARQVDIEFVRFLRLVRIFAGSNYSFEHPRPRPVTCDGHEKSFLPVVALHDERGHRKRLFGHAGMGQEPKAGQVDGLREVQAQGIEECNDAIGGIQLCVTQLADYRLGGQCRGGRPAGADQLAVLGCDGPHLDDPGVREQSRVGFDLASNATLFDFAP
jgi:hypothetical protein